MGWLWTGRGKPRSRPRVARAIAEAREAHAGAAGASPSLGGATALMERAIWTHELRRPERASDSRESWDQWDAWNMPEMPEMPAMWGGCGVEVGGSPPARRRDFGEIGLLLERAEDTARKLGRSRAEMWEEALRTWLDAQPGALAAGEAPGEAAPPAPRPWLFEARRQRVWGEIDETLGALRTA